MYVGMYVLMYAFVYVVQYVFIYVCMAWDSRALPLFMGFLLIPADATHATLP